MATYIYDQNGNLYSWNASDGDPVASETELALNGLAAVTGLPPLDEMHVWNPATLTVDELAAPPPPIVTTARFTMLFTPDEFVSLVNSTDPVVLQAMFAVKSSQTIDLGSPEVIQALDHLVTLGLVTSERLVDIKAGRTP
jgi:hypothetical protein